MRSLIAVGRGVVLLFWLLLGALIAAVMVNVQPQQALSVRQQAVIRWWIKRLLSIMQVRIHLEGEVGFAPVWISNHVSWLDIPVLMSIAPSRFLSKAEVADWPLVGWLASRAGTVYIRRGNGETAQVAEQLRTLVSLGDRVVFFPEGTSYAAEPGRFHARIFSMPLSLGVSLQPIALAYGDGQRLLREDMAYVGDESFMANLWRLLEQEKICVRVIFLPPIQVDGLSRNQVSEKAESSIRGGWKYLTTPSHLM